MGRGEEGAKRERRSWRSGFGALRAESRWRLGLHASLHPTTSSTTPHHLILRPYTYFSLSLSHHQHFSHPLVSILDGGLPRWLAEGHPVDRTTPLKPNEHTVYAEGETAPSYQPVFSELLYAVKPRIESYFVADIEASRGDFHYPPGRAVTDTACFLINRTS